MFSSRGMPWKRAKNLNWYSPFFSFISFRLFFFFLYFLYLLDLHKVDYSLSFCFSLFSHSNENVTLAMHLDLNVSLLISMVSLFFRWFCMAQSHNIPSTVQILLNNERIPNVKVLSFDRWNNKNKVLYAKIYQIQSQLTLKWNVTKLDHRIPLAKPIKTWKQKSKKDWKTSRKPESMMWRWNWIVFLFLWFLLLLLLVLVWADEVKKKNFALKHTLIDANCVRNWFGCELKRWFNYSVRFVLAQFAIQYVAAFTHIHRITYTTRFTTEQNFQSKNKNYFSPSTKTIYQAI